jgi:hypothetical protein
MRPEPSLDVKWNERVDEQQALVRHWLREVLSASRDLQKLLHTKAGPKLRVPKVRTICRGLRWPASEDVSRADVLLRLVERRRWEGLQMTDAGLVPHSRIVCMLCRHSPSAVLAAVGELQKIARWLRDRIDGYSRAVELQRRSQLGCEAAKSLEAEAVVAGLQRQR